VCIFGGKKGRIGGERVCVLGKGEIFRYLGFRVSGELSCRV
jgi:hypothetical protein